MSDHEEKRKCERLVRQNKTEKENWNQNQTFNVKNETCSQSQQTWIGGKKMPEFMH